MTTPIASSNSTGGAISRAATQPGGALGKDQFLKMLVAQMTHQDPLNPMDGQQMAAQLAQFSSVEQLIALNDKFDAQATSNNGVIGALNSSAAVSLIGKHVTYQGDGITVGGADAPAIQADIPAGGASVRVRILDATGKEVANRPIGAVGGGRRMIDISGATKGLADGDYTVRIEDVSSGANATAFTTYTRARVDGVRFGTNGAVLTAGRRTIPMGTVASVDADR